jgi:Tfp pilus assembly protein PilO
MNTTNSLALILISFGLFFLFGKNALSDIYLLRTQKQEYNAAIDQVNLLKNKENELTAKLNDIPASERQKIETFFPTKDRLIRLVADIDGIASKLGIGLTAVDFSESTTDLSRSVSEAPAAPPYNSKTISMTFSSSYQNLKLFLTKLEKSLRIIDIRSIDLGQGSDLTDSFSGVYQYKVSADVYWLKDSQNNKNNENE